MEKVSWDTPTMAELYLEQGHKERAVQIYQAVVQEFPNHEQAKSRLRELSGGLAGEQAMVFEEQTRQFVNKIPGAIACSVMGFDGIAIATHTLGGLNVDVEALFTEVATAAAGLMKLGQEHPGLGQMQEWTLSHDKLTTLLKAVNKDYFVAAIVESDAIIGRARFELRIQTPEIAKALSGA
jgi:predicted regulator of Ras-like GTPase activity (Roadblock/LC7/MglB family)